VPPEARPRDVVWRDVVWQDEAPTGKLDLLLSLDFRMIAQAFSTLAHGA
jgi:nitrate reductase alpha subunit